MMRLLLKHTIFLIVILESLLWIKDSIYSNELNSSHKETTEYKTFDFIFIGDSYAEVQYLDTTYVDYFAKSGIHLLNFTSAGMEWGEIKEQIALIEQKDQKDLLLFIQLGDFINYRNNVYQASISGLLKKLKSGDEIIMDGSTGEIEIIKQ